MITDNEREILEKVYSEHIWHLEKDGWVHYPQRLDAILSSARLQHNSCIPMDKGGCTCYVNKRRK